jgi:hypothetical protein
MLHINDGSPANLQKWAVRWDENYSFWYDDAASNRNPLVDTGTFRRVHVAEHIELVETGEDDEKQVPGH